MKADWSHLDEWRIKSPRSEWHTSPGIHYGAFILPHPHKRQFTFEVIATDGKQGGDDWEHVSVKVRDINGTMRIPGWVEMDWIKRQFWEDDEIVAQFHVNGTTQKVDVHPCVLHLWRHATTPFPMPDKGFV